MRNVEAAVKQAREAPIVGVWQRLGLPEVTPGKLLCSPWREDTKPSLQVGGQKNIAHDFGTNESFDTIGLVQRVRECSFGAAVEWITGSNGNGHALKPTIANTYDYRDEKGVLRFQVVRMTPKDFFQRRPDGRGGWINRLKGVARIPYRLPELMGAVADGQRVFVAEGEKDADSLAALGLCGTCNAGGAGKWEAGFSKLFAGARVAIVPDNDDPGRKHAADVASKLHGAAAEIRIIELPGLPEKGDVSDWLAAGHTREELEGLATAAPVWTPSSPRGGEAAPGGGKEPSTPRIWTADELQRAEMPEPDWIVPGLLPQGLGLLVGRPKIRKSWLALGLCESVAIGGRALGQYEVKRGSAFYGGFEDSDRRLKMRQDLILAGYPAPDNLSVATQWPRLDHGGDRLIEQWLESHPDARLVVLDTLAKLRPRGAGRNENAYDVDYSYIAPFKTLADKFNVCILFVHHLRKGKADDPLEMVSGTFGLTGAADTIWIMRRAPVGGDAELLITGRDVEEQSLAMRFEDYLWTVIGNAEDLRLNEAKRRVLSLLDSDSQPFGPREICAMAGGLDYGKVRKALMELSHDGRIKLVSRGKYVRAENKQNNRTNRTTGTSGTSQHVGWWNEQ